MSPTRNGDIKVAAAPVSWGVFEQTGDDPRQLGPEPMLDQMAAAGYDGTELGPRGMHHPNLMPFGVFPASDGAVAVAAPGPRH